MENLDLASTFVLFFALLGPQKVLLSFAHVTQHQDPRTSRRVAVTATCAAIFTGALCAWTAPWLTGFFHIGVESVELAGGIVFFVYAVGLVLGLHLGLELDQEREGEADPLHPVVSGFRELLLPFVVSPLAVTAVLVEALYRGTWGWRSTVVGAFAAVAVINLTCMLLLAPVVRRAHTTALEVLSRLLGMLLAAVGVELFLLGLSGLGVLHAKSGH
ncbi:MAG: MarC family protein [Streptosporangiaceae bacterium]|nr:MarC family protein [Streptosporangiaceae bacterium]